MGRINENKNRLKMGIIGKIKKMLEKIIGKFKSVMYSSLMLCQHNQLVG